MKIKTEMHIVRSLFVTVPKSISTSDFENAIGVCVRDGELVGLRDGITVTADMLDCGCKEGYFEDCTKPIQKFLNAVNDLVNVPPADEFLFAR